MPSEFVGLNDFHETNNNIIETISARLIFLKIESYAVHVAPPSLNTMQSKMFKNNFDYISNSKSCVIIQTQTYVFTHE